MEKNKGLQGVDGAVIEGLHVGQSSKTTIHIDLKKVAYVEENGAVYGHMHDKSNSGNNSLLHWKRANRIHEGLIQTEGVVGQSTKTPDRMGVHMETLGAVVGHMQAGQIYC